jgi:predicted lipid carrier protein YhbT
MQPLARAPYTLQSLFLKSLLSRLFKQALAEGELVFLQNKWLNISIIDARLNWFFSCDAQNRVVTKKSGTFDVSIRGNLKSFALLAAQKEDPDTLFFQRDLLIEGDTDLGLSVKNLLDSLDWETLPPEALFLLRSGAEYMHLFSE